MSNIYQEICNKKAEFEKETGKNARFVYLGEEEFSFLAMWSYLEGHHPSGNFEEHQLKGENRPEIDGLLLMLVNAESHFEVGA